MRYNKNPIKEQHPQPHVKIIDLQHNLMQMDKMPKYILENTNMKIDVVALKVGE
jgi:hypothetical protein